eukprot:Gb_08203 [translate_table: standard]
MGSRLFTLLLLILVQLAVCVVAQRQHNITLDSTLHTFNNSKWVSSSGEFAFGFYSIGKRLYLLGIWFDKIPEKTLVWTANRDDPVDEGSTLELTGNGDLTLLDSHRDTKWFANKSTLGEATSAAILDSGNFVLLDSSSEPVWQSFDSPTDTLLPGQTLRWKSILISKSNQNYSSGRFELELRKDGEMLLFPVQFQSEGALSNGQGEYWNSVTGIYGADNNSINLNLDKNGVLLLVDGTNTAVQILNPNTSRESSRYLIRVTLDSDGVLREYVRGREQNSSWSVLWRILDDPCLDVRSSCGVNGFCSYVPGRITDAKPNCMCPPGFKFIDAEDPSRGCLPPASTIGCGSNEIKELPNTDWPGGDYSILHANENDCKQACLGDCGCIVVIYRNGYCWKKRLPLLEGKKGEDIAGSAFVKLSADRVPSAQPHQRHKKQGRTLVVAGITIAGCLAILVVAALTTWRCRFRIERTTSDLNESIRLILEMDNLNGSEPPKAFHYEEIDAATEGFKYELGKGAFGTVFKGALPDGRPIAVKRLHKILQEGEKEFRTEMAIIASTHHRNLVQLLGYCDQNSHRLLVYEYMSNGSLSSVLFGENYSLLTWNRRLQIAMGIAKGMAYLQEECRAQIIHCDIKPQNILLDEAYNAKISDFGMAKLMGIDQTQTFTAARGTRGYLAPEWLKVNMPITVKVDVYSFGTWHNDCGFPIYPSLDGAT